MRTNFAGFFFAAGMGLIVLLLGLGALSAAGLVGFSAEEIAAEPQVCGVTNEPTDSAVIPVSVVPDPRIMGNEAAIMSGDALFRANCAQCHALNDKVVGPALAGITKRRSMTWIVSWVQNSAKVVASGDEYAIKLYNENGQQQMPSFALSKKEIEDIITWVNAYQDGAVNLAGTVVYCAGNQAK